MNASLIVIDDFMPDPGALRDFGLSHDFSKAPEFDGNTYEGFAPVKDFARLGEYFSQRISSAIAANVKVRMACFVAGSAGFSTKQWIHADNNCGVLAGVLYLFDKPGFGTAFWRHKSGAEYMSEFFAANQHRPVEEVVATMQNHGRSDAMWERTDYVESKFNRLILYPTDKFHSRWPEHLFGDKPENCRLTMTLFLDMP